MLFLWTKAFHIIFVMSWFAGLFYLLRIFVNLAMETETVARLMVFGISGDVQVAFACGINSDAVASMSKKKHFLWRCGKERVAVHG